MWHTPLWSPTTRAAIVSRSTRAPGSSALQTCSTGRLRSASLTTVWLWRRKIKEVRRSRGSVPSGRCSLSFLHNNSVCVPRREGHPANGNNYNCDITRCQITRCRLTFENRPTLPQCGKESVHGPLRIVFSWRKTSWRKTLTMVMMMRQGYFPMRV